MVDLQRFAVLGGGRWHCRQATLQRKSPNDGTQKSADPGKGSPTDGTLASTGPGTHVSLSLT